MCYEFDSYFSRARIAEKLRMKKPVADDLEKQGKTAAPAVPVEPEKKPDAQEPVPA